MNAPEHRKTGPKTYFITGFPGFIAKRLVAYLEEQSPHAVVNVLVEPRWLKEAQHLASQHARLQVRIFVGDVSDMHLGLSGAEYKTLTHTVTDIFHLAAVGNTDLAREVAWKVNVEGSRNVIELADDLKHLNRLSHFSTCFVSGDRRGVIAEDELDCGQNFRNAYEETKAMGERLMRQAMGRLPITIFRPAPVVGDSQTGAIDTFDGPYYLGMLWVLSPLAIPLPLPGNGVAPLHVVPVDYVVSVAWHVAHNPQAAGRTLHVVDPNPMSARRVYELIAHMANKRLPRFKLSAKAADLLLRLPGLEKRSRPQRAAMNYVNHFALYNSHMTAELLEGSGIRCPPLASYLEKLLHYFQRHADVRRELEEIEDSLDPV